MIIIIIVILAAKSFDLKISMKIVKILGCHIVRYNIVRDAVEF